MPIPTLPHRREAPYEPRRTGRGIDGTVPPVRGGAEFGQRVQLYNALGGGWPVDNAPQANLNMPASPAKE